MAEQTKLNLDDNEQRVFEQLGARLGGVQTAAEMGAADLCERYQQVKPILRTALPIIRKFLPVVADAIEFLMTIADSLCPED